MKIKSRKKDNLIIIISFWATGIIFLILSYLCFINVIQNSNFQICGSACEYWWSWLWDFPPKPPYCVAVCIPRNNLYKPFFVVGLILILLELLREFIILLRIKIKK